MQSNHFLEKCRWAILLDPSAGRPRGGELWAVLVRPFKKLSLLNVARGGFVNAKPNCIPKPGNLGVSPSGGSFSSWGTRSVFHNLCSSGKTTCWGLPSNCKMQCPGWILKQQYVSAMSTYFEVDIVSFA